jgi:hypothetical protein
MEDNEQSKPITEDDEQSQPTTQRPNDRFSRLMFGPFPPQQSTNLFQNRTTAPQQGLDFIQLMQDIDTLVSSFDKLKPLMRKFTSFFDLFKK